MTLLCLCFARYLLFSSSKLIAWNDLLRLTENTRKSLSSKEISCHFHGCKSQFLWLLATILRIKFRPFDPQPAVILHSIIVLHTQKGYVEETLV